MNPPGKPASHEKAKEILAGLIGAFVDREVKPYAPHLALLSYPHCNARLAC